MLKEIMYMIFLSAHSEFKALTLGVEPCSSLKLKALTPGVDGQPAGHPFITPLLEARRYSLRGPIVGHTYIPYC
jgi:hypothetical protein